jgi:hypothetical protein
MGLLKLVCMLAALAYIGWQVRQLLLGRASQQWRSTKGKVLRSYVDEQAHSGRYGTTYTYTAHVEYTYHVGGRQFESKHLTYEPATGLSEDAATQLLDGITEGIELDVFYDPLDWERAVLIPGTSGGNIVQLAIAIGVFALVTWLCFFADFSAHTSGRYH